MYCKVIFQEKEIEFYFIGITLLFAIAQNTTIAVGSSIRLFLMLL